MTLLVGSCCAAGSVLLTDSLKIHHVMDEAGNETEMGEVAPGKLAELPDAGVIYGHSGLACDVEDFRSEDFAGAVWPLHTELRRYTDAHPWTQQRVDQALALSEGSTEQDHAVGEALTSDVLAASLNPEADGPHMGLITSEGEDWLGH